MPKFLTVLSISVRPPIDTEPFCPMQTSWSWVSISASHSFIKFCFTIRGLWKYHPYKVFVSQRTWIRFRLPCETQRDRWLMCQARELPLMLHMPIKQWGAQGRRAVCKLYSFIQDGRSPCGATSPVPYHLYANKSLLNSIPIRVPQDKHVLLYKGRLKKKSVVQLKCGELLLGDTGVNKAGQSLNAESHLLPL